MLLGEKFTLKYNGKLYKKKKRQARSKIRFAQNIRNTLLKNIMLAVTLEWKFRKQLKIIFTDGISIKE